MVTIQQRKHVSMPSWDVAACDAVDFDRIIPRIVDC